MRYLLLGLLIFPVTVFAQLSSENFQVDSFSVGGTQSTAASSANFQISQETGGLFELESGGDESAPDRGSSLRGRAGEENDMENETLIDSGATTVVAPDSTTYSDPRLGQIPSSNSQRASSAPMDDGLQLNADQATQSRDDQDRPIIKRITRTTQAPLCTHSWLVCTFPVWVPFAVLLLLFLLLIVLRRLGYEWW